MGLTEYAGAQHSYDNPTSPPLVDLPEAQSTRNCRLKEGPNGTILDARTDMPYSLKGDACVAIGAHVGYSAEATAATREAVIAFLKQVLLK